MRLAIEGKQQNTIFRKCFQLFSGVAQHRLDNSSMSIGFLMNHDTYMQGILCFIDINISRGSRPVHIFSYHFKEIMAQENFSKFEKSNQCISAE
jgi:hypothetical protein